ncbi:uncharacterized protein LOC143918471 [Arctopsyche grandis]|uniref:uncharacterized protein LOC143918471 n=1 Tax=Arctopsyche grandis TaxID=121162 RepID=UPI00406D6B29
MAKAVFYLLLALPLFNAVYGFDKRLQDLNLDFLNYEGQNRKQLPTQPQPLPQKNEFGVVTSSTTSKSGIQNQPGEPPRPNQPGTPPQVPPKPNVAPINIPAPNPGPGSASGTTTNVRQLIKNYNDKIVTSTTERPKVTHADRFPTPPKSGPQPNPPSSTGPSWASIAAGKGPSGASQPNIPTTGNVGVPSSPTQLKPQPQIPAVAPKPQPNPTSNAGSSWASVASGKGPSGGSRPSSPTQLNPQPQFPAVAPSSHPNPSRNSGSSWASVASGKGPTGGSKPSSPTQLKPQPQFPTAAKTTPKPGDAKTTAAPEIASDKELSDMSEALLNKDVNNPAKFVTLNSQQKTTSFSKDDLAPEPLFTIDSAVWNIPTISAMRTLLDNYEQDTTVNEHVTAMEKNEENVFLDAVMATSVMRHLMTFLKEKGIVTPDPKQQRDLLKQTWFNMYSRGGGKIGSSGFEHIFLSEIKNNEISGLHNWLYFHTLENARQVNYLGYLKKVDISNKGNILKLHFNLKGIDKPVDSMFVGTSPELEMALYSLCFYTRPDKSCPLTLSGQKFNLRTHTFRYRSKNMIGSAFPEI